jgi:phosphoglycolate phosphatase
VSLRLIVFDCDGTLVDSQAAIIHAMREAFAGADLPAPSADAIRGIVGLSVPQAVAALAPGQSGNVLAAIDAGFRQASLALRSKNPNANANFFEGARDCLDRLNNAGELLGVATGMARRGLDYLLDQSELRGHFVTTQSADDAPSKPHPGMLENCARLTGADRIVMVGDTSFDMAMAKSFGCHAIGVSWGYHSDEMLRDSGADLLGHDFNELERALAAWG